MPARRSCSSSGATTCLASRRTGTPARSSSTADTSPPRPGTTPTTSPSNHRCTTSWAAPPSSTAPRCTGCDRRTSASCTTSTACPRPGRSPTTTSSRGTRRPSGSTRCTATAARTRPRATAPRTTRGRRCRTSRASSSSSTTCRRAATTRSTPRAACCCDEADRAKSDCIRCTWCDGYPCLVHAKADAETIAVRPILDLPERHAAGQRRGRPPGHGPGRADRHRRGGVAATATTRPTRPRSSWSRPAPSNTAKLLLALGQRRPPDGPGQRVRPGRAQLHVPQQQGGGGPLGGGQRHAVPEDARAQRLLPRLGPTTTTRSATSRWWASPTPRP